MIELRDVTRRFAAGMSDPLTAVRGANLSIGRGSFVVIKGPSGSGKTTLLAMIGCMARPTSGRIILRGVRRPWAGGGSG